VVEQTRRKGITEAVTGGAFGSATFVSAIPKPPTNWTLSSELRRSMRLSLCETLG